MVLLMLFWFIGRAKLRKIMVISKIKIHIKTCHARWGAISNMCFFDQPSSNTLMHSLNATQIKQLRGGGLS
jgi:hypothetical protein